MIEKRTPPWKEGRRFGFTMAIVLGLVGGLMWMYAYHASAGGKAADGSWYARLAVAGWITAVVFGLLASAAPKILLPVNQVWMAVAEGVGFVMSRVILGTTYFLVLTPIALVMRRRGFDPMKPSFEPERESYWELRDPNTFDERHYERQY